MAHLSRCVQTAAFLLAFALISGDAQTLEQAAAQLASRVPPPGVSLAVENLSSLPAPEVARVREAIQAALVRAGLATESKVALQVTISENARGILLIARIPSGDAVQTVMVPWTIRASTPQIPRAALSKTLVVEQAYPILDINITNNGTELWLLEPGRLVHFGKNAEDAWAADRSTALMLTRPVGRNSRGKLTPDPRLPDSSAPWALDSRHVVRWAAGRNYFLDDAGGYYSVATVEDVEFKAGLDGRTRVTQATGQVVAHIDDWGSDLAAVQGSCGQWFLLTSARTEGMDRLQAYRVVDGQPVAAGEPLPFSGLLTALWPAETADGVTGVVHNRKTRQYEAYRIAITCGN